MKHPELSHVRDGLRDSALVALGVIPLGLAFGVS